MNPEKSRYMPGIALEILSMIETDQTARAHALRDPDYPVGRIARIDWRNAKRLEQIIREIGWPTLSKVGAASIDAALLARHADHDVGFQERCLELMKAEPLHEVRRQDIAYLEDRIRVNRRRPQVYGTQFDETEGGFVPKPIEDEANVDERRSRMALPPLALGIQLMSEKYAGFR